MPLITELSTSQGGRIIDLEQKVSTLTADNTSLRNQLRDLHDSNETDRLASSEAKRRDLDRVNKDQMATIKSLESSSKSSSVSGSAKQPKAKKGRLAKAPPGYVSKIKMASPLSKTLPPAVPAPIPPTVPLPAQIATTQPPAQAILDPTIAFAGLQVEISSVQANQLDLVSRLFPSDDDEASEDDVGNDDTMASLSSSDNRKRRHT